MTFGCNFKHVIYFSYTNKYVQFVLKGGEFGVKRICIHFKRFLRNLFVHHLSTYKYNRCTSYIYISIECVSKVEKTRLFLIYEL